MGQLDGKVAVVTGASEGIGYASALRFAQEGAYVYLTGRRKPELDEAVVRIITARPGPEPVAEAMACGCAIIGADVDPVREFIAEGRNGLLTPCLDPERLAERTLELLADDKLSRRLRGGARRYAEKHLDMAAHIAAYQATIAELTGTEMPVAKEVA